MNFVYNDGGRSAAGFKGSAGDCVCRAVAIASGLPYQQVYDALSKGAGSQRGAKRSSSARNGINATRQWFKDYMAQLGFRWVPCMTIGSGCQVHVKADELPVGSLILSLSKHYAAFINGTLHDTHDSSRDGTRCVYGYWIKA